MSIFCSLTTQFIVVLCVNELRSLQQFKGLSVNVGWWLRMIQWTAGISHLSHDWQLTVGMVPVCNNWPLLLASLRRVHMSTHTTQYRGVLGSGSILDIATSNPFYLFPTSSLSYYSSWILNCDPLSLSWHPTQETTHTPPFKSSLFFLYPFLHLCQLLFSF